MFSLDDGEFDLTIYVPTKGRPEKIHDYETNFYNTTTINTRLVFVLSTDDPRLSDYLDIVYVGEKPIVVTPDKPGFVDPLNMGYLADRRKVYSYAVGFMGDDHYPRTRGWDEKFVNELISLKSGFVYGDDGFQHEAIPTQIAMTADIPLELGYMTYPRLWHLYADNFWLDLGLALDRIKYLPDVLIEHVHPATGKIASDEGYEFSGAWNLDQRDKIVYEHYLADQLWADSQKLRTMIRRSGK